LLYRLCGKKAMCGKKAGDEKQFVDPGQEKGGCKRNPL
jgi:hypothetical protein